MSADLDRLKAGAGGESPTSDGGARAGSSGGVGGDRAGGDASPANPGAPSDSGLDAGGIDDCDALCELPNAVAACQQGRCLIASCEPGFLDCNEEHEDGCEREVAIEGPCVPDTGCTQHSRAGHTYFVCTNPSTWIAARDKCRSQLGGDLATLESAEENTFVQGKLDADAWIGAHIALDGLWKWSSQSVPFWLGGSTGEPLLGGYSNWGAGSPLEPDGARCAELRGADGEWNDVACTEAKAFVCEVVPDQCPGDDDKWYPGQCGCGLPDVDTDQDGVADCHDGCPRDADFIAHCPRVRITVDAAQVDAPLTDFPVLVRLEDDADLRGARPDGLDLFFSEDGGPEPLPFEIEHWDGADSLVAWVLLPNVNDDADTVFYLRHGDGSTTDRSNPAGVWVSDYRAVYHMHYGGGAGTQSDSTANGNHAPPDTGACPNAAPADQPSGIIGKALTFGGHTCNRLIASPSDTLDLTDALTISAWARPAAASGPVNGEVIVSKRIRTTEETNYQVGLSSTHNMYFMWGSGTGFFPSIASTPAAVPPAGAWSYLVWTVQGAPKAMRTYIDGERGNDSDQNLSNAGSSTGVQLALVANAHPLFIGGNDQQTDEVFFGDLDEVRIAAASRSPEWIAAEYRNQKPASTFLRYSSE